MSAKLSSSKASSAKTRSNSNQTDYYKNRINYIKKNIKELENKLRTFESEQLTVDRLLNIYLKSSSNKTIEDIKKDFGKKLRDNNVHRYNVPAKLNGISNSKNIFDFISIIKENISKFINDRTNHLKNEIATLKSDIIEIKKIIYILENKISSSL